MQGPRVLVIGRQAGEPPPGLPERDSGARYVMADDMPTVRRELAGCEIVFHYGQPRDALRANWSLAGQLRWVHIGGVGIDWALFPDLVESEVCVTNSRGVFDVTLPEYVLALMLAIVKDIPRIVAAQARRSWEPACRSSSPAVGSSSSVPARSGAPRAACCARSVSR